MTDGLEIVPSRLLVANMCINTSITSCTSQILAFSEWNMFAIRIFVAFSKTKINDKDTVFVVLIATNQEVIWLNISVNYPLFVDFLDALYLKTKR